MIEISKLLMKPMLETSGAILGINVEVMSTKKLEPKSCCIVVSLFVFGIPEIQFWLGVCSIHICLIKIFPREFTRNADSNGDCSS